MPNVEWESPERLGVKFTQKDFAETLDGGQSFCWYKNADNSYCGVFGNDVAMLFLDAKNCVNFCAPKNANTQRLKARLLDYLDSTRDYEKIRRQLFAVGDKCLSERLAQQPTLRILRQDINETIISFICSSSKRIVQIKQCVGLLRKTFGEEICGGFYTLPTFESLANADMQSLKDCKLGFRAAYLKKTAQKIVGDKFDTSQLLKMPYKDAKAYLVSLSGIGEKVADCILLFGAHRFEAFPVDTWIIKSMKSLYGLDKPSDIRKFAAEHFGENAGFAQQILFAAA